jgi:oligopeptide/dipeptide ABC transporter ATP-binding protein
LDLMGQLRDELGTAIVIISHDLGVIAETAGRVAVMYTGQIMESADTLSLFANPLHPYTRGLMQAIPSLVKGAAQSELYEIAGVVPSLLDLPTGCPFNPRCPLVDTICRNQKPALREVADGHRVACWMVDHA